MEIVGSIIDSRKSTVKRNFIKRQKNTSIKKKKKEEGKNHTKRRRIKTSKCQ